MVAVAISSIVVVIIIILVIAIIGYQIYKKQKISCTVSNIINTMDKYDKPEVFFFSEGYPGTPYIYYTTEEAIKAINDFNVKTNFEYDLRIANLDDLNEALKKGALWDTHGFLKETIRKQYDGSYDYNKEDIDVYYTLYTLISDDGLPGINRKELKAGGIIVYGKKPFKYTKYGRFVKSFNDNKWSMYDT